MTHHEPSIARTRASRARKGALPTARYSIEPLPFVCAELEFQTWRIRVSSAPCIFPSSNYELFPIEGVLWGSKRKEKEKDVRILERHVSKVQLGFCPTPVSGGHGSFQSGRLVHTLFSFLFLFLFSFFFLSSFLSRTYTYVRTG